MATSTAGLRAHALGGEDEEFPELKPGKATAKTFQNTRRTSSAPNVATVNPLSKKRALFEFMLFRELARPLNSKSSSPQQGANRGCRRRRFSH